MEFDDELVKECLHASSELTSALAADSMSDTALKARMRRIAEDLIEASSDFSYEDGV